MAKLGKETYHQNSIWHEYEVHFSKRDNCFFAKVPDTMKALSPDKDKITGNTYDEAKKNYTSYFDDIYSKGIKQEKVIIYFLAWKAPQGKLAPLFDYKETFSEMHTHNMPFEFSLYKGENVKYKMLIDYRVKLMITVANKVYICDHNVSSVNGMRDADRWQWGTNGYTTSSDWINWEYMPYSLKAEKFFEDVTNKLAKLCGMIGEFFGSKPEHLIKNISNSNMKELFYVEKTKRSS